MMNAVLSSFSEGVTFLLQSFRLAFVVPSTIFVGLNSVFVLPVLPRTELGDQFQKLDTNGQLVIILAISFLLGYFLSITNIWIIRLFEGYHWRETFVGKLMVRRKQIERDKLTLYLNTKIDEIINAENKLSLGDPARQKVMESRDEFSKVTKPWVTQMIQDHYPTTQLPFLPTSLGNAIAAFEDYPKAKYAIDAVLLWPRMLPTLTQKKFAPYVERSKAQFDFVINLCFLSLIYSCEILCIGLVFAEDWSLWVLGAGISIILAYLLYKLATQSLQGWGMTVRVAFDLYRYDLLGGLFGKPPENFMQERDRWATISSFLNQVTLVNCLDESDIPTEPFDYDKIKLYMDKIGLEPAQKEDK